MMQYYMPAKVVGGENAIVENARLLGGLGKKALVVTGRRSAKKNGSFDDVVKALTANGQGYALFDRVMANPTVACAFEAAGFAQREGCDFVVAIGGGSAMDTGNWEQLKNKCVDIEEARKMGAGNGGQLNPDWVEALMGYPQGWTDIDAEAAADADYSARWLDGTWEDGIPRIISGVKNRIARLKCLGNTVVPQIPAYLWVLVKAALWA